MHSTIRSKLIFFAHEAILAALGGAGRAGGRGGSDLSGSPCVMKVLSSAGTSDGCKLGILGLVKNQYCSISFTCLGNIDTGTQKPGRTGWRILVGTWRPPLPMRSRLFTASSVRTLQLQWKKGLWTDYTWSGRVISTICKLALIINFINVSGFFFTCQTPGLARDEGR